MTILERKMNRTTRKLIENLKKTVSEVPENTELALDDQIQVSMAGLQENTDIRLKAAELKHVIAEKISEAIEKHKQKRSNSSARGV